MICFYLKKDIINGEISLKGYHFDSRKSFLSFLDQWKSDLSIKLDPINLCDHCYTGLAPSIVESPTIIDGLNNLCKKCLLHYQCKSNFLKQN